jgi:hypothetical protein
VEIEITEMINKASKLYGLTVKIIRREARYG